MLPLALYALTSRHTNPFPLPLPGTARPAWKFPPWPFPGTSPSTPHSLSTPPAPTDVTDVTDVDAAAAAAAPGAAAAQAVQEVDGEALAAARAALLALRDDPVLLTDRVKVWGTGYGVWDIRGRPGSPIYALSNPTDPVLLAHYAKALAERTVYGVRAKVGLGAPPNTSHHSTSPHAVHAAHAASPAYACTVRYTVRGRAPRCCSMTPTLSRCCVGRHSARRTTPRRRWRHATPPRCAVGPPGNASTGWKVPHIQAHQPPPPPGRARALRQARESAG